MSRHRSLQPTALAFGALLAVSPLRSALAQNGPPPSVGSDSTVLRASERYGASRLHRLMLGHNYRNLWATPITVPILDLTRFAGGVHPTKTGGGAQTKTLHFETPDGVEYVFRPVHKALLMDLEGFEGTIVEAAMADGLSASYPVGPLIPPAFLDVAGVPHPRPILVVLPDDVRLGKFRGEFGGMLGMIEEHPNVPDDAPGFAGAVEIIDSDELLRLINRDPREQVDARALLRARLIDLLLNDNDRHPDQWKWARLRPDAGAPWVPIPRDRDKVLVSYEGWLLKLARLAKPELVTFSGTYPNLSGLFQNAIEFDRRLLGALDKLVWDSVATTLARAISDSVVDAALRALPAAYQTGVPSLAGTIRSRRDRLPAAADGYYRTLFRVADIHATDAADRATIRRTSQGEVEVRLQYRNDAPYLVRRFDPRLTSEIRLYLHEGDDSAVVTVGPRLDIPIRIIGGNGNNTLIDSSAVGGRGSSARFYDIGTVDGIRYPSDSSARSHKAFNRRPLLPAYGRLVPADRDRGGGTRPTFGVGTGRDLGLVGRVGITRTRYGFRSVPYQTRVDVAVGYSTGLRGFEIDLETDRRLEESRLHVRTQSRMSQLGVGRFVGFGNDAPYRRGVFHDVRQTQWAFHPALAFALGPASDVSLGPIVKYTATDSLPDRLVSELRPYGFSHFGQAGLQLNLTLDTRARATTTRGTPSRAGARTGFVAEVAGSAYPAIWDATSAFARASAVGITYVTIPVPTNPVLALRAGGEKVWGEFPYFEAAFLGGSHSLRIARRQRYAGDASLHGSAELRVPVASFPFILPVTVGVLGFLDAGRVYLGGRSAGGWHTGAAAGFWIGVLDPGTSVTLMVTNQRERRLLVGLGFDY